jgi:AhpD family alkylhydroperoxidase
MYVSPVDKSDLSVALRELADSGALGTSDTLVQVMAHAGQHAERFFPFYYGLWFGTTLEPRLRELARLAIADTTHCPLCATARMPDATEDGLTEVDIEHLRDLDYPGFSPRERAAIRYALLFGEDHDAIGEAEFVALHEHMSEQEIVELAMLCAQWLGFGRLVKVFDLVDLACPIVRPHSAAAAAPVTG